MLNNTSKFWDQNWEKHFTQYIKNTPYQSFYLDNLLAEQDKNILEIAGGSFRDTYQLNQWGYRCTGIDSSEISVALAKQQYPSIQENILKMDARNLQFEDKSFDVSFHSGFFICFQNDDDLKSLIQEQIRVTKRCIVCSVHNRLNAHIVRKFKQKAKKDRLFDIRFFSPEEMIEILEPHCKKVVIYPYSYLPFDLFIKLSRNRRWIKTLYSQHYASLPIKKYKRFMAVGYLE